MDTYDLIAYWHAEEASAKMHGWDFSHIGERYTEETDLPWNYRDCILRYLKPDMKILDVDTGGGEFLLSLEHPCHNISATEAWPPNVELCTRTLLPLGIDFRAADGKGDLQYPCRKLGRQAAGCGRRQHRRHPQSGQVLNYVFQDSV